MPTTGSAAAPTVETFSGSPAATVGVEWELQLIDLATRELYNDAADVLADLPGAGEDGHPKVKHELMQHTLEASRGSATPSPRPRRTWPRPWPPSPAWRRRVGWRSPARARTP